MAPPVLVVVTGPAGAGKMTLAHELAATIRCPAICRDEIKEGMAVGQPQFVAAPGDPLTRRTLPVFFGALAFLLESGVTTVAEAAFQHQVWAPNLTPLTDLATVRIVRCRTDPATARERVRQRAPHRSAHADASVLDDPAYYDAYTWLDLDVATLDVDTTNGYHPSVHDLARWATDSAH